MSQPSADSDLARVSIPINVPLPRSTFNGVEVMNNACIREDPLLTEQVLIQEIRGRIETFPIFRHARKNGRKIERSHPKRPRSQTQIPSPISSRHPFPAPPSSLQSTSTPLQK